MCHVEAEMPPANPSLTGPCAGNTSVEAARRLAWIRLAFLLDINACCVLACRSCVLAFHSMPLVVRLSTQPARLVFRPCPTRRSLRPLRRLGWPPRERAAVEAGEAGECRTRVQRILDVDDRCRRELGRAKQIIGDYLTSMTTQARRARRLSAGAYAEAL